MTKLTEIEALADAASGLSSWQCDIPADDIKAMCQLIRQQHELIVRYRNETPLGHQPHMIAHVADEALAKYEEFNK